MKGAMSCRCGNTGCELTRIEALVAFQADPPDEDDTGIIRSID